jgi:hypothetical protein
MKGFPAASGFPVFSSGQLIRYHIWNTGMKYRPVNQQNVDFLLQVIIIVPKRLSSSAVPFNSWISF